MDNFYLDEIIEYTRNGERRQGRLLPHGVEITDDGLMFYVEDLETHYMYEVGLSELHKIEGNNYGNQI